MNKLSEMLRVMVAAHLIDWAHAILPQTAVLAPSRRALERAAEVIGQALEDCDE